MASTRYLDAAFVDCIVARRQGHPVVVARTRIRPVGTAGAALTARLNEVPAGLLAGPLAGRLAREVPLEQHRDLPRPLGDLEQIAHDERRRPCGDTPTRRPMSGQPHIGTAGGHA
jgi:hypothetical protein